MSVPGRVRAVRMTLSLPAIRTLVQRMIFAALWQALTAAKTLKRGESAPDMQPPILARLVCLPMTGVKEAAFAPLEVGMFTDMCWSGSCT